MRLIFSLLILFSTTAYSSDLISFKLHNSSKKTLINFKFDSKIKYKAYNLTKPNRIVLDLLNVDLKTNVANKNLPFNIKKIRVGKHPKLLRFVFDVEKFPKFSTRLHNKNLTVSMLWSKNKPRKENYVVAIDPGHGGQDSGSVSKLGIKEKDIALKVSLKLEKLLTKNNIKAVMTRRKDEKIDLFKRMQVARNNAADLFVSLHADAFYDKKINGASVYVLSEKEDDTVMAKWLANRNNRSDLSGGINIKSKDKQVASTLLELSQNASRILSKRVASNVLNSLQKITKVHTKEVNKANFMVLKSPDIPSVLIELGFLSNYNDSQKLVGEQYQMELAKSIKQGIIEYFKNKIHSVPTKVHKKISRY